LEIWKAVLIAVGAFAVGAGLVSWWLQAALARAQRRLAAAHGEIDDLEAQLRAIRTDAAKLFDETARQIDETTREAVRVARVRSHADQSVWDLLEPVSEGGRIGLGDMERITRQAEIALTTLGAGLRPLTGEIASLQRSTGFVGDLAAAFESLRPDEKANREIIEAANDTIVAATALDESLQRVEERTRETTTLSAKTSTEAEAGYRAVHRTLDEIERIRDLTEIARTRINVLGARVDGIGDVVRVIQEIAEKTNLLALNASIIAAQAGQHGRSFAVVAREIKALAQRTASSTKEISDQIRAVQEESERATTAMEKGSAAVDEGFQIAIVAGDALTAIRESALATQKRVLSMARGLKQQSSSARQVVDLAGRVSERANSLSSARGTNMPERLAAAAAELQATVARIAELVTGQRKASMTASDALSAVIAEISNMVRVERELRSQVDQIQRGAASSRAAGDDISMQLHLVREAATRLRQEIGRLQVG
jgi:methyl-accepting chemotaxis protein